MSPDRASWLEHRRKEKLKQKGAMSELTQCNYCSLQRYKREAKERKMRVSVLPSRFRIEGMTGLDVYVHPKTVSGTELAKQGSDSPYHRSWMGDITERCVC